MMWRNVTVNLSDLLFSVSGVMDLSDPTLVDHQIRTAFVASEMALAAKLDYVQTERLFVAALLHDIGALSPEEKIGAHIYEDISPELHCQRGGKLFREAFWLEPSAEIVEWHHTPMKTHKSLGRTLAQLNVLSAQIVYLSDHLERFIRRDRFILHQKEELRTRIHALAGNEIHPDVIRLFDEVSASDYFWLELVSKDLDRQLKERNILRSIILDFKAARSIAGVFKDITDYRSRFTATHSSGVAACAVGIAEQLAFTGKDLQQVELAGLIHDIGKLVVPNAILCKDAPLTAEERRIIHQHPYYTYRILSQVRGLEQVAEWAGFHHERLDGSGYSKQIDRTDLDLGAKMIAVADVATAIAETRPYRGPGDQVTVIGELRKMAKDGLLEPIVIEVLIDNYASIMGRAQEAQAEDEARFIERYAMLD
jgi:HD-GYP domain-containing protein (c-di-GMP phosphodiesterase class II)